MKTFLKPKRKLTTNLYLTALVDVCMVLALFSLEVHSQSQTLSSIPQGLRLPHSGSSSDTTSSATLRVEVTQSHCAIEGELFEYRTSEKQILGESIQQALISQMIEARKKNPEANQIRLVADAQIPFHRLEPLIKAAEEAGIARWSLVSSQGASR